MLSWLKSVKAASRGCTNRDSTDRQLDAGLSRTVHLHDRRPEAQLVHGAGDLRRKDVGWVVLHLGLLGHQGHQHRLDTCKYSTVQWALVNTHIASVITCF